MTAPLKLLYVTIAQVRQEATDVLSFELRPRPGTELPRFTAGAHIDVHLPELQVRSYSLLNDESERNCYVIAVRKEANGRGGSRYMHEQLAQGCELTISPPKNNFPLIADAPHVVFISGGIGITPIWSMIQRLHRLGRSWELHYCARSIASAPFYNELRVFEAADSGRVRFHFDDGALNKMMDVVSVVRRARADAHLYCCGPLGMMNAFRDATAQWPSDQVHTEYFSAGLTEKATGAFEVELARSGKTIVVGPGKSILDAVVEVGIDAPHSCKEGVCGSCETRVISGAPDHRDLVLTAAERASGQTMMICCSGCIGSKLVLDL